MLRRKRSAAALKERPAAVALKRTIAPQRVLQSLNHHQTVHRRFASEETGLAPVLIVAHATHHPHSACPTDKCCYTCVRQRFVVTNGRGILRQVFAEIAIRDEKPRRDATQ